MNNSSTTQSSQPNKSNHKALGIVVACATSAALGFAMWRRRTSRKTAPKVKIAETPRERDGLDAITLAHQCVLIMRELVPVVLPNAPPNVQEDARHTLQSPQTIVESAPNIESSEPSVARIGRSTKIREVWELSKAAVSAWIDDFAPSMGAAIAYYTMFSIAPMLIIAIAVAGFIFGQEAAQGEIVNQIRGLVGNEGAIAIQGLIKSANEPTTGIVATTISIVTLAIGATAVFAELQSALDRIWRVPAAAKKSGIWNLIRTRLLSFGLILGLGFMLMVSLVVSAALAALGTWWGAWFEGWELMLQALNLVLSFFVFAGLFSVIYKFMPRVHLSWHDVWIGAVVTTVLFIIGKYLIGLYLGTAGVTSGFGAAGSFALLLVWIYYSAQIFLLGAEFTWIYANNFGSKSSGQKHNVFP